MILIRRRDDAEVVGFSTVTKVRMKHGRRRVRGIFSGDTIIDPDYWGSRALQVSFLLYMLRTRLRHPFAPLFWLLISKGYKTYLLLANNFPRYYPNPDGRHTHYETLVRQYCDQLFPGYWCERRKVLDFGDQYQCLKGQVAEITPELARRYPRIGYFEQRNPEWRRGTELPCIGQVGYSDFLVGGLGFLRKLFRSKPQGNVELPASEPAVQRSAQ